MTLHDPSPPPLSALPRPGMKITVACSGGADSVALLRTLLDRCDELGLVLSVAHMHHGIRGEEADSDAAFVEQLANQFGLPFHLRRVDVPATAETARQGLEETARSLRYAWFWELLSDGHADAVATAHTLDDQAETVLHRLLRGAWTEGLGGIFPTLQTPKASPTSAQRIILRPFLATSRYEIEEYLRAMGQHWREDSTNRDTTYTRNRLRHELLPALAEYNPGFRSQLAHVAALARDDEAYWQVELSRLLPALLLPGTAVRGGGRATNTLPGVDSLAIEIERLRALHPALRRRVLRAAADRLGVPLDFDSTERLLELCDLAQPDSRAPRVNSRKLQMEKGLCAERTPRELRLSREGGDDDNNRSDLSRSEYTLSVPGQVEAPAFGLRLEATLQTQPESSLPHARLRFSRTGDRVTLLHSRSPLKIKEALQRSRRPSATGSPVLEWQGEIVWMPGIEVDSRIAREFGLAIASLPLGTDDQA